MSSPDGPVVSVIMPAHNAERYIALAIASVLGQSLRDFELIVIDDASSDSTAEIVRGIHDVRVRLAQSEGEPGAGAARNTGLRLARGVFAAFLDADDLAYPSRLAAQLAYMETHPKTALLGAGYDVINCAGTVLATFTEPSGTACVRWKLLFDNVIATSLAFAKRDVLLEMGLFNESYSVGEDHDLWARIATRYPIARLPSVLGAYREHAGGTYGTAGLQADAMRARVVRASLDSAFGVEITAGTALVLGDATCSIDCTLEDSITALALLGVLLSGPVSRWADSPTERREVMRVWIDKLETIVAREPRLRGEALRTLVETLRDGRFRDVWSGGNLRSALRLALPSGRHPVCASRVNPDGVASQRRTQRARVMNSGLSGALSRAWDWIRAHRDAQIVDALHSSLASCGAETVIHPTVVVVAPENVRVGEHVLLGPGVWISAVNTSVTIGSHVMMAPRVALVAGDHNTSVVGRFMDEVVEKRPQDDQPIVVEDDVWLGMSAIVLKGVRIGRGSIVSAGSIVTRDVAPYAVVGGAPARLLRVRFDAEQVELHERELYGEARTVREGQPKPSGDSR